MDQYMPTTPGHLPGGDGDPVHFRCSMALIKDDRILLARRRPRCRQ
jgi:hypothetical protein